MNIKAQKFHRNITFVFCLLLCASCVRMNNIREILHDADSLRSDGKIYPDSIRLDSVVNDLKFLKLFYPDEYAAANYHYGRLLLEKDNPLDAAQCFINVVHTLTNNHTVKGRAYCNMGVLCQSVDKYNLAYKLYRFSYDCFEKDKDTVAMGYALNDIALACAKMHRKEEFNKLMDSINAISGDSGVQAISILIKAITYRNYEQYDSAAFFANKYLQQAPFSSSALLIKAQSFYYLNNADSAVHYAKKVVDINSSAEDVGNALYILQQDNNEISTDSINAIAAQRIDIQNLLDNKHRKLSQAALLIEQKINKQNRYTNTIIITAIVLTIIIALTIKHIKKKNNYTETSTVQQLNVANNILDKKIKDYQSALINQLELSCESLRNSTDFKQTMHWDNFTKMCEAADFRLMSFATKLNKRYNLTEREVRLCILILINGFKSHEIAQLLYYSETGIRNFKSKIAKKFGTSSKSLRDYLLRIAINSAN